MFISVSTLQNTAEKHKKIMACINFYGCKTWSVIWSEKLEMQMFENKRTFGKYLDFVGMKFLSSFGYYVARNFFFFAL